jgi:hypothetical protein
MQVAPTTGAFFTGQQVAQDRQNQDLQNADLAAITARRNLDYGQQQQMNPLLIEQQRLNNTGKGLSNTTTDLTNQKTQGTLQSDIGAINAKNNAQITDSHIAEANKLGEFMATAAMRYGNISNPTARTYAMAQYAKQAGFDLNDPSVQQLLQMDPDQLIKTSQAIAQHTAQNTPAYIQATDVARISGDKARDVANISRSTQLDLEDKRINAGKYNSKKLSLDVNQALLRARSAAQAAEVYNIAAQAAIDAGDTQEANKYTALAQQARQRAAEDANNRAMGQPGVDVPTMGDMPPKPRATSAAPIGPAGGGTPPPQNPVRADGRVQVIDSQGRVGTIPAEQLEEALKQGYKRK